MLPIILSSIIAFAIVVERLWSLRRERVIPAQLVSQIWQLHKNNKLTSEHIRAIQSGSPLGRMLAAGLLNRDCSRAVMKEAVEDAGRQVVVDLERFFTSLGTIAAITPLLGLLGTVFGMIEVFAAITSAGVGDPTVLAGGISKALLTTAAGLTVAIPSLMFHRYLIGKVDRLIIGMEEEALKMIEVMHGERVVDAQD